MANGKMVPPKRPMIIRPDTSFFSLGDDMRACEKITEKTLELPNPISPIPIYNAVSDSHTKSMPIATSIMTTLSPKKSRGEMERSRNAPMKHPAVRNMKYTLVAKPASSSGKLSRSMMILGAVVLVPTSMPT